MIRILQSKEADAIFTRRAARLNEAEDVVRPILEDVRKNGDRALLAYARKFDQLDRKSVVVANEELEAARKRLTPAFCRAVKEAAGNIREFAKLQLPDAKSITIAPGLKAGQIVRPLDAVAAYIPSGRYPLPSTLLMTAVPAQVAGVKTICCATPRPVDEILGSASLLKLSQTFLMGGAHAIAAFAFGTETVPKVDRIVGPGNIYVAAAKKLLAGEAGIDFVAGPTEILIIANDGNPTWIAADMLAQAEHDTDAAAVLLTRSSRLAKAVAREIERQLQTLPTSETARVAIDTNSAIVITKSDDESLALSNRFAPEHLSLHDASLLKGVKHAGGIFLGASSPEAAGDYAAGPSHVLPTSGYARVRGGLSAMDFVKTIAVQELTPAALRRLAPTITTLARAEGLEAHARSVEVRTNG